MTGPGGVTITISERVDFAALGEIWRDLETRSEPSFFQTWTWTGCLAEERFTRPVLVEARRGGRVVALALFNRRGRTLYLGESGDQARDCVYIEYNGVLSETGSDPALVTACLCAARRGWPLPRRLVLSGIDTERFVPAREIGRMRTIRVSPAPFADLVGTEKSFLERRSANTRQQLRRSERGYGAIGTVSIEHASNEARGHALLDELARYHQASWVARGHAGAFANPFFGRFHHALIARGFGRGEIDLARVTAGDQVVGLLYNFRYRGRHLAYQGGFAYPGGNGPLKPGLTCHQLAIQDAIRAGAVRYEFLAGEGRYKRSLSDGAASLGWMETASPSPRRVAGMVRTALGRMTQSGLGRSSD